MTALGVTRHLCEDISDMSLRIAITNVELKQQKKDIKYILCTSQIHMFYPPYTSQVNRLHPLITLHKVRLTSSRLLQGRAASNGLTECI